MSKNTVFYGIDISKSVFDVYNDVLGHKQYINNDKGISSFIKTLPKESHCVMEATGSYHYLLAMSL